MLLPMCVLVELFDLSFPEIITASFLTPPPQFTPPKKINPNNPKPTSNKQPTNKHLIKQPNKPQIQTPTQPTKKPTKKTYTHPST